MGFSFTATAQCDYCGQLLGSSDEECDHEDVPVDKHVFRRLSGGRESMTGVKATGRWKWYKLAEEIGEDWIAYEYLGTKTQVNSMLGDREWQNVEDLPTIAMSIDAPNDVNEEVLDVEEA